MRAYHIEMASTPHALELPQMYTKPSYESLIAALNPLKIAPPSWSFEQEQLHIEDTKAVAAYLTQIVSNGLEWLENDEQRDIIYQIASQRLSERSGRTGMSAITRTWTIPASSTCPQIALEIHEPPMIEDHLGLKTWASSYLLAKRLETLGSRHLGSLLRKPEGLRCLELGAGTGLVGLAACCVWGCSIRLTDLPDIVPNLSLNANRNIKTIRSRGGQVTTAVHDWRSPPPATEFQVILAADPLYSPDHAFMLTENINQFLSNNSKARVIIEVPVRDKWTEKEAENLQSLLREKNFELLEDGFESGFDDWEENGERLVVRCWWGVFGRQGADQ